MDAKKIKLPREEQEKSFLGLLWLSVLSKGTVSSFKSQAVLILPLSLYNLGQALSPFCSSFSTFTKMRQKDPLQFLHGKNQFNQKWDLSKVHSGAL